VDVLSVIHGTDARAELFAPVVDDAGHALDEWSFAWGTPPPRPLDKAVRHSLAGPPVRRCPA